MNEDNAWRTFGSLFLENPTENIIGYEREDELKFHIWRSLYAAASGANVTQEFEDIGQEIKALDKIQGLGIKQLAPLAGLGGADLDVRFLYGLMAMSRREQTPQHRDEIEEVTTLLRVASLIHAWGDSVEIGKIIKAFDLCNIQPETLLGIQKFLAFAGHDAETRLFILHLIPSASKTHTEVRHPHSFKYLHI